MNYLNYRQQSLFVLCLIYLLKLSAHKFSIFWLDKFNWFTVAFPLPWHFLAKERALVTFLQCRCFEMFQGVGPLESICPLPTSSLTTSFTTNIFFSFLPLKISFSYCSAGLTLINLALCYVSTGNMWPINETRLMVCWWFELAGVSLFFVQNLVNLPILCMATIIPARLRSFSQWFHSDLYSRRMS